MSTVKGIDPGRLNKRVSIMRYTESLDEQYNTIMALKAIKTVWAEIRPKRGNEQAEYYKTLNTETYKITIRYTNITEKDVIEYKGQQYKIVEIVDPLLDHYYLELLCVKNIDHAESEEGDADG